MTSSRDSTLVEAFDAVVCDLDGVVYRGSDPVDGAVEALREVRSSGRSIAYATNNASRPPAAVAEQLRAFGLELEDDHVVTSAQAGAHAVLERLGRGAQVLAIGGPGVASALRECGLVPVTETTPEVSGVLQGFGSQVAWGDLAEAAYAVEAGAVWVATNTDATLPTERGHAPGNGTLVAAVARATGVDPHVVGKPHAPLYELARTVLHTGADATLAIGDRIDTDIAGAHAAGLPALHVLTGVHGPADLAVADPDDRPRYVARDLAALHRPYRVPVERARGHWECGAAVVRFVRGRDALLEVQRQGEPGEAVRAALAASWQALDAGVVDGTLARRLMSALDTSPAAADS